MRPLSLRRQIQDTLKLMDAELAAPLVREGKRASALKALETRLEVLNSMLKREEEEKEKNHAARISELESRLKSYDGIDPTQTATLVEENRTLRAQLEHSRTSNQSWADDVSAVKSTSTTLSKLLSWFCSKVTTERRTVLAIACFNEFAEDSRVVVDTLMGVGITTKWASFYQSRARLIEVYKAHRHATAPDDVSTREFCKTMLTHRHQTDVEAVLRTQAEETRQQQEAAEKRREQARLEYDIAQSKLRRSEAREEQIRFEEIRQSMPSVRPEIESW